MDNEDVPYRAPVNVGPTDPVMVEDEVDLPVIVKVKTILDDALANIDNEGVFDLSEAELSLKEQIGARRVAKDIIEPIRELVYEAIGGIDEKYKERQL